MKSNTEFRNLAWKRLWADHWFGRLFGGGLLLGLCGSVVQIVLGGILGNLGVQSWFDYLQAVVQNRCDLTSPVPNLTPEYVSQACSSTVLTVFFSSIMAGIASYGCAVILKKCLANDEKGWLCEAFGGFRFPFGMLWLQVRYWLVFLLWGILAWLPVGVALGVSILFVKSFAELNFALAVVVVTALISIGMGVMFAIYAVPFYRYRFVWLVKAEHPDWRAGECLRSCKAFMEGHKYESFRLDCSYWRPIALVLLLMLTATAATLLGCRLCGYFALLATFAGCVVLSQYLVVGQGLLYEELKGKDPVSFVQGVTGS